MNPKVKELLKSVNICQSYCKNKSGTFLMAHGVETGILHLQLHYATDSMEWIFFNLFFWWAP